MSNSDTVAIDRKTKETDISGELTITGGGEISISTGIGFFDHMLSALALWAGWSLILTCKGDLEIDTHHTVEDVALALGDAYLRALEAQGPNIRVGSAYVPMDETLTRAVVDISGRPYCVFRATIPVERVGQFETITTGHFFRSLATAARLNLHVENIYGDDPHHQIESMFKAVGRAFSIAQTPRPEGLLSTKGTL